MNNYDSFVSKLSDIAEVPTGIYAKIRFRIVARKVATSVSFTVPVLCVFALVFLFNNHKEHQHYFDISADAEELLFAQNNNFYLLFDDK